MYYRYVFRNTLGEGDTKFKALSTKHDLGDPLVFTKEKMHETLSSKIAILDRETFANFATHATALVLTQANQENITDQAYFTSPYSYVITLLACSNVPIAKRSEFIMHLQAELQPGFYSAGKAYMAQALAHANHMAETISQAKVFFNNTTTSYERSLIWSCLGNSKTPDDIQDVTKQFSALCSLPSPISFEHQKNMLWILARQDKETRSNFVTTIQPLTILLTNNGIGWSVKKLSELTPELLKTQVNTLIDYVNTQNPDEMTYIKYIGAFK